jgi:phage terminase large subunit
MDQVRVNVFAPTRPHAKQQEVLKAFDGGERFIGLRAGRKFRKTSLMISWLFERALETGLSCPYIAPNRIQAKNIAWDDHIQRILTEFKQKGLRYRKNEVELSIKLPNNGEVQLYGVENKEALRGISNWGAVGMDEYDDWDEDIYSEIIRPNLIPHKAPVFVSGTPKGFKNLYRLESGNLFRFFHFRTHDNPDIDPTELVALEAEYKEMGMGAYRQEILAEYEKPEGTVYSEWDLMNRYIPCEYDANLPLHLTWDFGVNDPTSIIWLQPRGSELRVVDYYEASDANLEHFIQVVNSKPYKQPELETGDEAGKARDLTTGKSPIEVLGQRGHHIRTNHIPNIPEQIRNTHRYIPRLFVSQSNPNCERVRDCLLNYSYPKKGENLVNQSNEIPKHDQFSHCMRALEYYCWNYVDAGSTNRAYSDYQRRNGTVHDNVLGF